MAKPKPTIDELQQQIDEAMSIVDRINPEAAYLNNSALSLITSYIDTGSYALNGIMAGTLYGGIPSGRLTGFIGPSGCGKTVMLLKAIANAQRNEGRYAIVFDSEIAIDQQTAENLGCDVTKFKHIPIDTIENFRNQASKFLDAIIANPALKGRFIMGCDSLANLSFEKEITDAEKNKHATDMGARAKALKSCLRVLTYKAARANCPIIFTNHIFDDPGAMYESIKKNQSGGKGPEYMASVLVQFNVRQTKELGGGTALSKETSKGNVTGVEMTALTTKNRIVPGFQETELAIHFTKGFRRYAGLFEMGRSLGVIEGTKSYSIGKHKLGPKKEWFGNKQAWDDIVVPAIDVALREAIKYSASDAVCDDLGDSDEDDE